MNLWGMLAREVTVSDLAEFIERVKELYTALGIWAAIGLPYLETLFPVLPLFLMTAFNILSYGLLWGYIYTFIGTFAGTVMIFVFFRYLVTRDYKRTFKERPRLRQYFNWIETTHPALHILVLMVPFSPTFTINYSMGLTKMKFSRFLLITFFSRALMLVICIPLGMTLITLYEAQEFGGVQIMWLTLTGLVILCSTIFGQIANHRIRMRKTEEE